MTGTYKKAAIFMAATMLAGLVGNGYAATADAEVSQVLEQEIRGITPEMLDWWWDNINSSERYQQWYPEAHLAFEWIEPPANPQHLDYSVGATHQAVLNLGGHEVTINVTGMPVAEVPIAEGYDRRILLRTQLDGYDDIAAPGWVLHEYAATDAGDGIRMRTSWVAPAAADSVLPGFRVAFEHYLAQKMQNLPGFLPQLFQQEFIETELISRGTYQAFHSGFLIKTIVVDQEIKGITPDMMSWWWDNINNNHRYQRWHPTAHVSFKWVKAPIQPDQVAYSVGAVQEVSEYIGRFRSTLLITWLDPDDARDKVTYDHWLYAKTDLKALRGIFPQRLIHEYRMNDTNDGILMRSTFTIPSFFDFFLPGFSRSLGHHALQEMQFLQYFLPALFEKEYSGSTH